MPALALRRPAAGRGFGPRFSVRQQGIELGAAQRDLFFGPRLCDLRLGNRDGRGRGESRWCYGLGRAGNVRSLRSFVVSLAELLHGFACVLREPRELAASEQDYNYQEDPEPVRPENICDHCQPPMPNVANRPTSTW